MSQPTVWHLRNPYIPRLIRVQRNCHACGQCLGCSQDFHTILNRYGRIQPTIICHRHYPIDPEMQRMHGHNFTIGTREYGDEHNMVIVQIVHFDGAPFITYYAHSIPIEQLQIQLAAWGTREPQYY